MIKSIIFEQFSIFLHESCVAVINQNCLAADNFMPRRTGCYKAKLFFYPVNRKSFLSIDTST